MDSAPAALYCSVGWEFCLGCSQVHGAALSIVRWCGPKGTEGTARLLAEVLLDFRTEVSATGLTNFAGARNQQPIC